MDDGTHSRRLIDRRIGEAYENTHTAYRDIAVESHVYMLRATQRCTQEREEFFAQTRWDMEWYLNSYTERMTALLASYTATLQDEFASLRGQVDEMFRNPGKTYADVPTLASVRDLKETRARIAAGPKNDVGRPRGDGHGPARPRF